MINARQHREPQVAAVELCSSAILALIRLREFAAEYPKHIKAATELFTDEHASDVRLLLQALETQNKDVA